MNPIALDADLLGFQDVRADCEISRIWVWKASLTFALEATFLLCITSLEQMMLNV